MQSSIDDIRSAALARADRAELAVGAHVTRCTLRVIRAVEARE